MPPSRVVTDTVVDEVLDTQVVTVITADVKLEVPSLEPDPITFGVLHPRTSSLSFLVAVAALEEDASPVHAAAVPEVDGSGETPIVAIAAT